ncbi:ferredoxin [Rhodococcus opacus]|nr:ferredoxin [Rhodococcus opacus]RZK95614.1 MAG: ferredoxin [Rhodococcus sp. (in: high G+C Gram-positive bacteria)]
MSPAHADSRAASLAVDRSACAGHGLCYGAAPEIVDSDDQGYPVIVADPVPPELRPQLADIVEMCPERALSAVESPNLEG